MPAKSANKKKGTKRKAKVVKAPRFTAEELNEEIDTFLTCYNPYMSQNTVEFDLKSQTFKQTPDFRKPVFFYRSVGNSKQKLLGRYGVYYEEVPVDTEKKLSNDFNFNSKATQTAANDPMDRNEFTDPNIFPVLTFGATVSKETILKAYEEHEKRKQHILKAEKRDCWLQSDLHDLVKKIGRKELSFQDVCRKYLRLCERMLDQNSTEANLDFNYYDSPTDEFTPNVGSLLPLWKLSFKDVTRMSVTSLSWNAIYRDLLAVGFRKKSEDDEIDEDDLGLMRESGCMCVISLKSSSHPEKTLHCLSGVSSVSFHPHQPHLVAVGFLEGSVAIFDIKREATSPTCQDSKFNKFFHMDQVAEVRWQQATIPHKFCSVSMDGQIINWLTQLNDLFPSEVVTTLHHRDSPIEMDFELPLEGVEKHSEPPVEGLETDIGPLETVGDNLGLNSCATALSVHPQDKEWFLVGSEMGLIHLGSFDDKICSATYRDHQYAISSVHWNPLHPRVFLSCSKDNTVQVWDQREKHSVFEFFFENEVKDVAWAPFSSTLFAAISGDAVVSVFDLAVKKSEEIGSFKCYTRKQDISLTRVVFHPTMPVLLVGDDRGSVIVFKLSPNLRASLKTMETLERSKFVDGEIEKMEKLLKVSKIASSPD